MKDEFDLFLGVDLGSVEHAAVVTDAEGKVLLRRAVKHEAEAIRKFLDALGELCQGRPDCLAAGFEAPHGALVESMMERGHAVFSSNPKQIDGFRDRLSPSGCKDDFRDAWVISDSLRKDRYAYRRLEPQDPLFIMLREVSRAADEVRQDHRRSCNRLWSILVRVNPALLDKCPGADQPWLWELLERAPTPSAAKRLRRTTVEKLHRRYRLRALKPDELYDLAKRPRVPAAPGVHEAAAEHIRLLLPTLRLQREQIEASLRRCKELLDEMPARQADGQSPPPDDGSQAGDRAKEPNEPQNAAEPPPNVVQILLSFPGIGVQSAAVILSESAHTLFSGDLAAMRTLSGAAAVREQSGKRDIVKMRHACNPRLRNALFHACQVAARYEERLKALYETHRNKGHSVGRTLRSLTDCLLRILFAMLRDGTLYRSDHPRHGGPAVGGTMSPA